jgi:hypothetical protein
MLTQAANYSPGNTDLSWTRITPWRALLAAALDQYPAKVLSGVVSAERANPSADLLIAWLTDRLDVEIRRAITRGPGITDVSLMTGGGEIEIARPDGRLAQFTIPNSPQRPVALNRRELAELLAEELRRLDPDDVYEDTVKSLCRLSDKVPDPTSKQLAERTHAAEEAAARVGTPPTTPGPREKDMRAVESAELEERIGARKANAGKAAASERAAKKTTATKTTAKKTTAKKTAAKKTAAKKQAASS